MKKPSRTKAPSEPSGNADPAADPDGDGLSNLTEYALGGHPLSPSPGILPIALALPDSLGLSLQRYPSRSDLTLTVSSATSPHGPWSAVARSSAGNPFTALSTETSITESGPAHVRSVSVSLPASQPRQFLRLAISSP